MDGIQILLIEKKAKNHTFSRVKGHLKLIPAACCRNIRFYRQSIC